MKHPFIAGSLLTTFLLISACASAPQKTGKSDHRLDNGADMNAALPGGVTKSIDCDLLTAKGELTRSFLRQLDAHAADQAPKKSDENTDIKAMIEHLEEDGLPAHIPKQIAQKCRELIAARP